MENKLNLVEILKDCPKGMELDCTMLDDVVFEKISFGVPNYPIVLKRLKTNTTTYLTKYGQYSDIEDYKCVIFPKGRTSWEGFQRPFKDGDIVFYNDTIAIFKEWGDETLFRTYVTKYLCCDSCIDVNVPLFGKSVRREIRFATEEEKQKLFKAIKEQGYKWNAETKTLEKLKFKVGDKIVHKIHKDDPFVITEITEQSYKGGTQYEILIEQQDNFELVPNKFDISSLVPFESRVLIRNSKDQYWVPAFWGYMAEDGYITTFGHSIYCIPFEGNAHLLKTKNDCDEYFKTWE